MEPYVEATSLAEAERALDRLREGDAVPADLLGDHYDDLAEAAANERELCAAIRLERKALEAGCGDHDLARQMLGWYLIEDGQIDEGEKLFAELRREHPDDVYLVIALGHARSSAGLEEAALVAFDDAVAVAKRAGSRGVLDRARIERRAEREHFGLPPDEDDRLAPEPRPLVTGTVAWAVAWFSPDQRAAAARRWPALAEDFDDPVAYARRIEDHLTSLRQATGQRPRVAALDVDELSAWSEEQGYDPDSGAARSQFAAELARTGRALVWPPGRNDPCWCRSGRKYKRCCGGR